MTAIIIIFSIILLILAGIFLISVKTYDAEFV